MTRSGAPPSGARRLRAIVGGSAGNLVEWYDWYAHTSLSLCFAASFFPKRDATAQLLGTAAVFALGVSLPCAIGNASFGGTAEYVALKLKDLHVESIFYWYVSVVLAITTVCFWLLPETKHTSLIVDD